METGKVGPASEAQPQRKRKRARRDEKSSAVPAANRL